MAIVYPKEGSAQETFHTAASSLDNYMNTLWRKCFSGNGHWLCDRWKQIHQSQQQQVGCHYDCTENRSSYRGVYDGSWWLDMNFKRNAVLRLWFATHCSIITTRFKHCLNMTHIINLYGCSNRLTWFCSFFFFEVDDVISLIIAHHRGCSLLEMWVNAAFEHNSY